MTPPPFLGPPPGQPGDDWAVPGVTGLGGPAPIVLPPVSEQVAVLQQAITGQLAVDRASLPGPQALADTAGLLAAREQLDRVLLACIGDVEVRQLARAVDGATTSSWLRAQDGQAPASVATARRLVQHPSLGQALADGRLAARAAARVGQALAALRPHLDRSDGLIDGQDAQQALAAVVTDGVVGCLAEAFGGVDDGTPPAALLTELAHQLSEIAWQVQTSQLDRLERALVLLAEHLPLRCLPGALEQLSGALLPQQLEDAAERAERDRRLLLTRDPDGGGHVSGRLTPEAYELLHTVLSAAMHTDPGNPSDTAGYAAARQQGWLPGDPLPGAPTDPQSDDGTCVAPRPVVRSRAQRLHDALLLGLRALLDSAALGTRGKHAPHVGVVVGLDTLHRAPGALPARGDSGQRLPLSLVDRWLQDSWITRFVLDLRHRVVETSHRERTLKAHERRIKDVETARACESATCPYGPHPPPGVRLVPHHPDAYARTGTTSVDDTAMLCEQDHWRLHHGATLTLRKGRRLHASGWLD